MQFYWRQSRRLIERKPHLILQLGRVIILIALGHNPLLLLHRCYLTLDDGVQLSAHIVLDIHLMTHYFVRYCLLEFSCFISVVARVSRAMIARFQTKMKWNEKKLEFEEQRTTKQTKERFHH